MKSHIAAVIIVTVNTVVVAQPNIPRLNEAMPSFTLTDIKYFDKNEASLSDFRGEWIFIEFWYSGCATCIKSLPKVNSLAKQFSKDMQFIFIGCTDPALCFGKGLQDTYERLRVKLGLEVPSAYDSVLFKEWKIWTMPRIYIIDPDGVVRVITDGRDITPQKISDLLRGVPVEFYSNDKVEDSPVFNPNNEAQNLLYNSILTPWNGEKSFITDIKYCIENESKYSYQASQISLFQLYNLAYFGQPDFNNSNLRINPFYGEINYDPVLELDDSSLFVSNGIRKFYNYSITIPSNRDNAKDIMRAMQVELHNIFGYDVSIEKRKMTAWKLIAKSGANENLTSKGGKPFFSDKTASGGAGGFTCNNCRMEFIMSLLTKYINDYKYPYIDETAIKSNVDITIDALLLDFAQVQSELERNGLRFIKGTKEMKVLVVRSGRAIID